MNRVLFLRLVRRNLVMLGVYAGTLLLFEFFMVILYPTFGTGGIGGFNIDQFMRFMPSWMTVLFGGEGAAVGGFGGWLNFAFTHPIVLFLFAALPVSLAARAVAGEIGGGTGEILFTRPILRRTVVLTNAVHMTLSQIVLGICAWGAIALGHTLFGIADPLRLGWLALAVLDTMAVTLAFGFFSLAVSAGSNDGGRVRIIGGGAALFFYIFNLIALLWQPIKFLAPFGLFYYFQPGALLNGNGRPLADFIVAILVSLVCLAVGMLTAEKRDL